jgi:hypothetical protein
MVRNSRRFGPNRPKPIQNHLELIPNGLGQNRLELILDGLL